MCHLVKQSPGRQRMKGMVSVPYFVLRKLYHLRDFSLSHSLPQSNYK